MRRRWPVAALAVGGTVLLASLYLPWLDASLPGSLPGALFFRAATVDGWSTETGGAAAVADLFLVVVAMAALARPSLEDRLPLSESALMAFYLAVAVGAQSRTRADTNELGLRGLHYHYAYGGYLGIAVASAVLIACVARWGTAAPGPGRWFALRAVGSALVCTLLVALVLPWVHYRIFVGITYRGLESPAAVVAAAAAVWLLVGFWSPRYDARLRLPLAGSVALLTGAAFSSTEAPSTYAYGAWMGLASGLALLAVSLAADASNVRPGRRPGRELVTASVAGLLVTSLFLPWQTFHYGRDPSLGQASGRSISADGWGLHGTVAAVIALWLFFSAVWPRETRPQGHFVSSAAIAVLLATTGFRLLNGEYGDVRGEISYGAKVGFAAAALIVVLALARARLRHVDRPVLLAPIAVCCAYVVTVVLPWWDLLPLSAQQDLRFGDSSAGDPYWLTTACVLLVLALAHAWATSEGDRLVVLPAAMLALAAVVLFAARDEGIAWGGGIVVGLSLLLILLGAVERGSGLESIRVPDILRVDRL